jgi:hypothetical protein
MLLRRSLLVLGRSAIGAGLCGFEQAPALTYNPTHHINNDPIWELLNQTKVVADRAKGEYTASFPPALVARENKLRKISGFILPLETTSQSAHSMLVRRNTGCPFCPPNAPIEAVEVFSQERVRYTGEEIAVSGQLKLIAASAEGLFYRQEGAVVA